MSQILSSYLVLLQFLFFTIAFSSELSSSNLVATSKLVERLVQIDSASEILLKKFFHDKESNPNVGIEDFLPSPRLKVTVHDLERSYIAYIFPENKFDPILISGEIYKCGPLYVDETIHDYSTCALFSTNKIYPLKSYILTKKNSPDREVFAFYDEFDKMFFVAIKNTKGEVIPIAHGKMQIPRGNIMDFLDFLNIILDAHNLNCLSKIHYKLIDFWMKYIDLIKAPFHFATRKLKKFPEGVFKCLLKFIGAIIWSEFYYHAFMAPFHIFSLPLELYFGEDNSNVLGKMTTNFIGFWIFPLLFYFVFRILSIPLNVNFEVGLRMVSNHIKPHNTMFAVPWLIENKKNNPLLWLGNLFSEDLWTLFLLGLVLSLPFLDLFKVRE